jgi:hypothetical protein
MTGDDLTALEKRISLDIENAATTVCRVDIHELPRSAELLPRIATLASELLTALNDLCNSEEKNV